jgi:signal transduction histidine kinase
VRAILERLRPIGTTGLKTGIERLVSFWESRRPDVDFSLTMTVKEEHLEEDIRETIYRVVQEGLSNAMRHAAPTWVGIAITNDAADGVHIVVTDDGVGLQGDRAFARGSARLGLVGMRERVMTMAGSLSVGPGHNSRGLRLVVTLPSTGTAIGDEQETIR